MDRVRDLPERDRNRSRRPNGPRIRGSFFILATKNGSEWSVGPFRFEVAARAWEPSEWLFMRFIPCKEIRFKRRFSCKFSQDCRIRKVCETDRTVRWFFLSQSSQSCKGPLRYRENTASQKTSIRQTKSEPKKGSLSNSFWLTQLARAAPAIRWGRIRAFSKRSSR